MAGETILRGPAPDWIPVVAPHLSNRPDKPSQHVRYEVVESHVRAFGTYTETYVHMRLRVLSPLGLQQASQLGLEWNPALQTPTVHHARIIRSGETSDILDKADFTILRREAALLIALALRIGRAFPPRTWLLFAALAAFLIFGGYCAHRGAEAVRDREAAKVAKAERKASTGRETASGERLNDQSTLNTQRKANDDALSPLPDAVPSDRRVVRHCLRMQRDGIDTGRFPECSRLGGQASAGR